MGSEGSGGSEACLTEDGAVAYVQRAIDDAQRAHLELHMDRCAACRWLVSELVRAETAHLAPARVGRYQIREQLGIGGMGVVYAAYDPQLDRKIALKLVRPGSEEGGQTRLLAEARAMARLSHPGVVPIYDVSSERADVVLAMELVDGEDARRWLQRQQPSWKLALDVLVRAGRGLAAAHAAGLVHRDVKPSNILIGRDGRARITDFGLARATPQDATDPRDGALACAGSMPAPVATRSALVGTPAYMAPEQLLGRPATSRSDQFSFCVVLYEAVFGERPFAASSDRGPVSLRSLVAEVTAGRVRPPPPGARVPGWLRRILLRGLAVDPEDRWPSLAAMLDRIEAVPRRRRLVAAAAGATTVVGIMGVLIADRQSLAATECADAPAALERSSSPAEWAAVRARIAGLGAYGALAEPELEQALQGFRARWIDGHRDACLAHRSGAQSGALLDLRMACLERLRASLGAAVQALRDVTADKLADTVVAVRSLPDPAACSDVAALLAPAPPPPAIAPAVAAAEAAITRIEFEHRAGLITQAHDESEAVVLQAQALGYRPLLARALLAQGRLAMSLDTRDLAAPTLTAAMKAALEANDDALAVEAWARAAFVKGTGGGKAPASVLDGQDIVEAMARRLRSPSFARALLENNLGSVELARGNRTAAAVRFERALAEARQLDGPDAVELLNVRGNAAMVIDDPVRRDAVLAEAEVALGQRLGAEHPRTLQVRTRRGNLMPDLATARDLLSSACARYERFHLAAAASVTTECWAELGYVSEELGDRTGALVALERVAELPGDAGYVSPEPAGYLLLFRGDARGASARFARALGGVPREDDVPWWRRLERARLELGVGRARLAAGDHTAAIRALDEAVHDLEEVAKQQPAAVVRRRLARAYVTQAQARQAAGAPAARVADAARKALPLLREEGVRGDELSALSR